MTDHAPSSISRLDPSIIRSLISVLEQLAEFFDDANAVVADAVSDHFDDLAAPDWIPLVLTGHARQLAELSR